MRIERYDDPVDQESQASLTAATSKTLPGPPPLPGDTETAPTVAKDAIPVPVVSAADIMKTTELYQAAKQRNAASHKAFDDATATLTSLQKQATDMDVQIKKYSGEVPPEDIVYNNDDNMEIKNRKDKLQSCTNDIENVKADFEKAKKEYEQLKIKIKDVKETYEKYKTDTSNYNKKNKEITMNTPTLKNKIAKADCSSGLILIS